MSLKYHLVERKDRSSGAASTDTLFYGQVLKTENVDIEDVCDEVSVMSTASPGDVKNVLSSLTNVLSAHLKLGQSVSLGELGTFRMTAGSHGTKTPEEFSASHFKGAHVRFYPGKQLRVMQANVTFDRMDAVEDVIHLPKKGGDDAEEKSEPVENGFLPEYEED
jgi:predicted histone-like DNA-binding protein